MNKKNSLKVITMILIMVIMLPYFSFADEVIFGDIDNSYVKSEIEALYRDGILAGTGQGFFNPKGKMDRAQLAAVLVRSLKLEEDNENAKMFTDVPQDSWYAGYVGALVKTGITAGTSTNAFSPDTNVTKQELAVFYIRALGLEKQATELKIEPAFSDGNKIANWAKDHVGLAVYLGLMSSIQNNDGTFRFEPTIEVDRELLADATYKLNNYKDLYYSILAMDKVVVKPDSVKPDSVKPDSVKPDPVKPDPVKPDPVKPDPVKPDPIKPDPIKPTEPTKPVDPVKPPLDDEVIKITNVVGKKMEFMGAYLMSVEFDIVGSSGSKVVKLVVNDGTDNEMTIKEGKPKSYDFYFDGMVLSVDTVTIYIGNERFDITNEINWR